MTMLDEDKKPEEEIDEETDPSTEEDDDLELDDIDLEDDELLDNEDADDDSDKGDQDKDKDKAEDEDTEALKKKLKQVDAQRKHWRERAKKLELEGKSQKPDAPAPKKEPAAKTSERTDFRFDHPELSTRMVEEVETYAKVKGCSLEEALKTPVIRIYIARENKRREITKASPTSRHQPISKKKQVDWSKASNEELEAESARIKMQGRK